jgi:hypothetical protein
MVVPAAATLRRRGRSLLLGRRRLWHRVEFRLPVVEAGLEGQAHLERALRLLRLALRLLELLRDLAIPRQHIGAWLADLGQLQPEIDAVVLPQVGAEHRRLLGLGLPPLQADRLR